MLLGIDLGTTALKVAAYDSKTGNLLYGVEKRLAVDTDATGRREQSLEQLTANLRQAIAQTGQALGGLNRVKGIALAAQGGSTIIVNRLTGAPRTPMILWNDGRAFPEFQALSGTKPARYWRTRTQRDEPGMGLARLAWLRKRQPALLCDENLYIGAGEFAFHLFTGVWRQDVCNAMQIGVYDSRRGALSRELAAHGEMTPDFFAPLREGHETNPLSTAGAARFGLPEGTPVAGPYMDHEAGYLSVAHVSARPLQCSLGTAWVGNFCLPDDVVGTSPFQFAIPAPQGTGQLIIQPLLTGNVTWDWALAQFVDANGKRALAKQRSIFESALLPAAGLVALPWLNRPNALRPEVLGSACMLGMAPATDRADLLRAVAAGMCYELTRVFEAVHRGGCIDSVVLSGGASQGLNFQACVRGLFGGTAVHQVEDAPWMGTRGALYAFGPRVSRARTRKVSAPALDHQALMEGYEDYLEAFKRLYGHITAGQAYAVEKRDSQ